MKTIQDIIAELEPILDSSKLSSVIKALAEICWAKGDHVRENWQDHTTADAWDAAARKLDGVSINFTISRIP